MKTSVKQEDRVKKNLGAAKNLPSRYNHTRVPSNSADRTFFSQEKLRLSTTKTYDGVRRTKRIRFRAAVSPFAFRFHRIPGHTYPTPTPVIVSEVHVTHRDISTGSFPFGIRKSNGVMELSSRFIVRRLLPISGILLGMLVLAMGPVSATETQNDHALGQQYIQFLGALSDEQVKQYAVPEDAVLIRLPRRFAAAQARSFRDYYMLVRNIGALEKAALDDAVDGRWDDGDQFRAALVAEGNRTPEEIALYEAQLDRIVKDITRRLENTTPSEPGSEPIKTQVIFQYLHRRVLTSGYDINCTDPAEVLQTGKFNCVSATVLFNTVGERLGLQVCGLEMPGHALSRVKFDTLKEPAFIDLETTCPNWFSLQSESARRAATQEKIASSMNSPSPLPLPSVVNSEQPAANAEEVAQLTDLSKQLREVTPVQLIATVYYNQGVDYLNAKQYARAAAVNLKALHLDVQSDTAWGNLMATINNWAIDCATVKKPRFDLAATLLDYGVAMDETYEKFRINQRHVYFHWIRSLALEGRYDDAMLVFHHADKRLPNDPSLKGLVDSMRK